MVPETSFFRKGAREGALREGPGARRMGGCITRRRRFRETRTGGGVTPPGGTRHEGKRGGRGVKVLLVNGSPRPKGCTFTALAEVAGALEGRGISTEIFQIGTEPLAGCLGCGACRETGRCFREDAVNVFLEKAVGADGFVFGAPVHFASAAGALTAFLDRAFFAALGRGALRHKPGAAVVSCRRAGSTAALDQLLKYFCISQMPVVSSQYWNMVHGNTPEEVRQDLEGLQTMRVLGANMAWLLRSIEAGRGAGVPLPEQEPRLMTNFVR